jgi:hypothetical protein
MISTEARRAGLAHWRTTIRIGIAAIAILLVVAMSMPATALGARTGTRAALFDVTSVGYDCTAGANKGASHVGSVTFTPNTPFAGYVDLRFVVRHLLPNTSYYLHVASPFDCNMQYSGILTDANGNADQTVSFNADGTGNMTLFVWLEGTNGGPYDVLATKAVVVTF